MQKVQNNQDHHDDDQYVHPIASARETRTDISAESAEQPQDKQDYDDCPQHEISPFRLSIGCHPVFTSGDI